MPFDTERLKEAGMTEGEVHMSRFVSAIEKGEQPPAETMKFFQSGFNEVLSGTPAKKALKLEKSRGRKGVSKKVGELARQVRITKGVLMLRRRGLSLEKSFELVSAATDLSYKTLERYYKKCKRHAEANLWLDEVTELLDEFRPHIPQWLWDQLEHVPADIHIGAARIWKANPSLSAEQAFAEYLDNNQKLIVGG